VYLSPERLISKEENINACEHGYKEGATRKGIAVGFFYSALKQCDILFILHFFLGDTVYCLHLWNFLL
jgi:hypothetical protein